MNSPDLLSFLKIYLPTFNLCNYVGQEMPGWTTVPYVSKSLAEHYWKMRRSSSNVEPVPQELLDIVDKINKGDQQIDNLENSMVDIIDRQNSNDIARLSLEQRVQNIECFLKDRPSFPQAGVDDGSNRGVAEGALLETENTAEGSHGEGAALDVANVNVQVLQYSRQHEGLVRGGPDGNTQALGNSAVGPRAGSNPQVPGNSPIAEASRQGHDYTRQPSRERFRIQQRPVWKWDEIQPGKFVYLKYYKLWHAVLVTGSDPPNNVVRGIHYALKSLVGTREVSEDDFKVNLKKHDVYEVLVPEGRAVSREEAVERGKDKVGEKKFNLFTRRSRHVVLECVLKDSE